jgi:hypothetical protein
VDPNRKRRRRKLAQKLGTGTPDPLLDAEMRGLSDEQLLHEYERETNGEAEAERQRAATEQADPLTGYLKHLSDDELVAAYEQSVAELAERGVRVQLSGVPGEVNFVPIEPAPMEPEPVRDAAPPVEPHPVALEEPTPPEPPKPPETARQKWEREQHEQIMAAIKEAEAEGEVLARLDHERGKRAPSETMGPSGLLDALGHQRGGRP